jgi:hypothetical protein
MEMQHYKAEVLEAIRQLSAEQIREVVDFAAFLRQRAKRQDDRLRTMRERAAARMEGRRRRIGPIGMKAADLVEAGRVARLATIQPEGEGR